MDTEKPANKLIGANPSDTLDNVSSVLGVLAASDHVEHEAAFEDLAYGRHCVIEICRQALDYESRHAGARSERLELEEGPPLRLHSGGAG